MTVPGIWGFRLIFGELLKRVFFRQVVVGNAQGYHILVLDLTGVWLITTCMEARRADMEGWGECLVSLERVCRTVVVPELSSPEAFAV